MRTKLNERRQSTNIVVRGPVNGTETSFHITCGFDSEGTIREVFCAEAKVGTDIHALITDSCIAISLNLQSGADIEKLAKSFGQNRAEGKDSGPPSSILGAIAGAILELQTEENKTK